jgi:hypothetical protein
MSIGKEGEEKIPTHSEPAALARKRDRQDKLAGKARARAKRVRSHVLGKDLAAENLEAEKLAAKYNGKKVGVEVVFGPEGETQLVFRRVYRRSIRGPDGEIQCIYRRVKGGVAGWIVGLREGAISRDDFRRELNKSKTALWNKEKGEGSLAFKAAEQLEACHVEIAGLRKLQLRERAKQEGVALIEPDAAAQETPYIYPKPEIDTLREELPSARKQLERVEEQLATAIYELIRARDAISLTFEALSKGLGGKMQKAFDRSHDKGQWPRDIEKLKWHAVALAWELQRPPTKAELRKSYNSTRHHVDSALGESKFSPLLKHAGLRWLDKAQRVKKKGLRLKRSPT